MMARQVPGQQGGTSGTNGDPCPRGNSSSPAICPVAVPVIAGLSRGIVAAGFIALPIEKAQSSQGRQRIPFLFWRNMQRPTILICSSRRTLRVVMALMCYIADKNLAEAQLDLSPHPDRQLSAAHISVRAHTALPRSLPRKHSMCLSQSASSQSTKQALSSVLISGE